MTLPSQFVLVALALALLAGPALAQDSDRIEPPRSSTHDDAPTEDAPDAETSPTPETHEQLRERLRLLQEAHDELIARLRETQERLQRRTEERNNAEAQLRLAAKQLEDEKAAREKLLERFTRPLGLTFDAAWTIGGPSALFNSFDLDDNGPYFNWAFGIEFHIQGFLVLRFQYDYTVADALDDEDERAETATFDIFAHGLPIRLGYRHYHFPLGFPATGTKTDRSTGIVDADELIISYGYFPITQPWPTGGYTASLLSVYPIGEVAIDWRSGAGTDFRLGIGFSDLISLTFNFNLFYHSDDADFGAVRLRVNLPVVLIGSKTMMLADESVLLPGWELNTKRENVNWISPIVTFGIEYVYPLDTRHYREAFAFMFRLRVAVGA